MKKIVTVVSALVLGITAMAQTDQGGWMFGAGSNLGFATGKTNNDQDDSESQFNINLRAGYFVIDNLAVGLDAGFVNASEGDISASQFSVGPYARYFLPMKIFFEAGYQFGSVTSDGDNLGSTGALGIGAGYAAFLNDNVSIEPSLMYSMTSIKPDGADESIKGSNFGIMINFGIYLGN